MSFADYYPEELSPIKQGLNLIGWQVDYRLTSDDAMFVSDIAHEALQLNNQGKLIPEKMDELALRAYLNIEFQTMNIDDRASVVTNTYKSCGHLKMLIHSIDEALICWYRGYYLAASAILFIVIERCMRSIAGWKKGDKDMTFAKLKSAIKNFPESEERDEAEMILNVIYSRYDATNPTNFFFNRHSLLHGIRTNSQYDEMNCVRMFLFLDLVAKCEGLHLGGGIISEEYQIRVEVYSSCGRNKLEQYLLQID